MTDIMVDGVLRPMTPEEEAALEAEEAASVAAVPHEITRRQLLIGLQMVGFITAQEAIDSAKGAGVPTAVQAAINSLPTEDARTAATVTWHSMSVAHRDDTLVGLLAAGQPEPPTSEQIDQFWIEWSKL